MHDEGRLGWRLVGAVCWRLLVFGVSRERVGTSGSVWGGGRAVVHVVLANGAFGRFGRSCGSFDHSWIS